MNNKFFILANPQAGSMDAENLEEILEGAFAGSSHSYELHYTKKDEDLAQTVRNAQKRGYRMIAAAGGDGTVSQAADGLRDTDIPLGIIPLGTGNGLAEELAIPAHPQQAVDLLLGAHNLRRIDGMKIGQRLYLLNVGVGLTSKTMDQLPQESKRKFGLLAYLVEGARRLFGSQPDKFILEIDGERITTAAIEINVTNSRIAGEKPFHWGVDIAVDDGRVYVCVIRAKSILDYLQAALDLALGRTGKSHQIRCYEARRQVRIQAARQLPVQADGEMVGETPVEIQVLPGAVNIIVPPEN